MHVKRLEVQGFKTFAKKTTLNFLPPNKTHHPITAIVGPNGSGKSNIADAMRWVLGEQSLKLLRGKKSEDVIFSGSEAKKRSGFAEVSITLDNTDKSMPIAFSEVIITRRLFRDGSSEYLLNEGKTRLSDIHLLLAQANVGQRSYAVIAQGMIDHILVASPEERKTFFDDATGVKQFQIKRHSAILKLKRTLENLSDVEMIIQEIEPRMRSLKRQADRLEKRDEVQSNLNELEKQYYGTLWWKLSDQVNEINQQFSVIDKTVTEKKNELAELDKLSNDTETNTEPDYGLIKLQSSYKEKQKLVEQNRREQFETEKEIELSKVRAQSNWAPLPLLKIIEEVKWVVKGIKSLKKLDSIELISAELDEFLARSEKFASRLQRPNPEDVKPDQKLISKLTVLKKTSKTYLDNLKNVEHEMDSYAQKEQKVRKEFIESQRTLRLKQSEIHTLQSKKNTIEIQRARFEERQNGLNREISEFMKDRADLVKKTRTISNTNTETIYSDIQRYRYKLELIGGIDPEVINEYKETKERYEFLDTQLTDLKKGINSTEKIVQELDEKIEKQSKKVFSDINKKFQEYFKILFGGGNAALIKINQLQQTSEDSIEAITDSEKETINKTLKKHSQDTVGVEIEATPPGKKLKSLNLLSGGERALTSIALLSAIMSVNPSPFVVLDEVDAALDESNTIRFAMILDDLAKKSQFIIITHNRATMEKADMLYGVTMNNEGISKLLSVQLKDITQNEITRR